MAAFVSCLDKDRDVVFREAFQIPGDPVSLCLNEDLLCRTDVAFVKLPALGLPNLTEMLTSLSSGFRRDAIS